MARRAGLAQAQAPTPDWQPDYAWQPVANAAVVSHQIPGRGPVTITSGNWVADNRILNCQITFGALNTAAAPTISIADVLLGSYFHLGWAGGGARFGTMSAVGVNQNNGIMYLNTAYPSSAFTFKIANLTAPNGTILEAGRFFNENVIAAHNGSMTIQGAGAGTSLVNDWLIQGFSARTTLNVAVTGHGEIDLVNGTTLVAGRSVAAGQLVVFGGTPDKLVLNAAGSFAATITGFARGDTIQITNKTVNAYQYSRGVLSLFAGGVTVARLHFYGPYTASTFSVTNQGGNVVIKTSIPPALAAATPALQDMLPASRPAAPGAPAVEPDHAGHATDPLAFAAASPELAVPAHGL